MEISRILNNIFTLLALFGMVLLTNGDHATQYIEFYSDKYCSNLTDIVKYTNLTLSSIPGVREAKSIKINGMWKIFRNETDYFGEPRWSMEYGMEDCHTDSAFLNKNITGVEMFGNPSLNKMEIHFYDQSTFEGNRWLTDPVNFTLSLRTPKYMESYHFTGNHEWSVYPNRNFTGDVTCLKPSEDVIEDGYGMTYKLNEYYGIKVGSCRLGCDKDEESTELPHPQPPNENAAIQLYINYLLIITISSIWLIN